MYICLSFISFSILRPPAKLRSVGTRNLARRLSFTNGANTNGRERYRECLGHNRKGTPGIGDAYLVPNLR